MFYTSVAHLPYFENFDLTDNKEKIASELEKQNLENDSDSVIDMMKANKLNVVDHTEGNETPEKKGCKC